MHTLARRVAIAGIVLSASITAQRTIVVDQNGGGNFTDIRSAIQAAAAGDTILVRVGTYEGFALDKGLRVLGDPGVVLSGVRGATLAVANIPLGQTAVVRGFSGSYGGLSVLVTDSDGHVHVESVLGGGALSNSAIRRSRNVTLAGATFLIPGLLIEQSTVAMTRCSLDGAPIRSGAGAALTVRGSRVWFSEGTCRGGALPPFPVAPTPGIAVERSDLFVAGDATTVIAAGSSTTSTAPVPAIVGTASNTLVDSRVTLQSHAGAPPYTGSGTFRIGRIPSLRADLTTPTQLGLRLHAPGALRGYSLLSTVPARVVPLGSLGDLWVELPNLVLDGGNVPASGVRTATFNLPTLPPGVPVMMQGLVVYPSGPQLSAPAPLTLGR